jgi:hypothetical protein
VEFALERLKAATSLTDVALILGFTPAGLSHTLFVAHEATRYRTFEISKSGGGTRVIDAPLDAQRLAQKNLAALLQSCRTQIDAETGRKPLSHGFRPGQSIITNARLHTGRRYVFNLDLADFFPTFNFGRIGASSSKIGALRCTLRRRRSSRRSRAGRTAFRRGGLPLQSFQT